MRGKVDQQSMLCSCKGITPAYAGKSLSKLKGSLKRGDHPRLCGEKAKNPVRYSCKLGSPPPMRGKVVLLSYDFVLPGITPAYAGKRKIPQIVASKCRDHPRLCGEKVDSTFSLLIVRGSPPPMRGKAIRKYWELGTPRITPAYAGKSLLHRNNQDQNEDHPRLCGEKATMRRFSCTLSGSPPPMRGKVLLYVVLQIWDRITPAYAGKSCSSSEACKPVKDHPRLCGEKSFKAERQLETWGSPPPMRGKGKEPCSV